MSDRQVNDDWTRFGRFMDGFVAANELLARASKQGFLVEYVCLSASIVDAMLRVGLVLKHQLRTKTTEVPAALIHQGHDERGTTERHMYKRALREEVIDSGLFEDLKDVYDERNKVVHRYIISDITTDRVLDIALRYEEIIPRVSEAIESLEKLQLRVESGMTSAGVAAEPQEMKDFLMEMSNAKHGSIAPALKRRGLYDEREKEPN